MVIINLHKGGEPPTHNEVQTSGSIVTIGSVGVVAAIFLLSQDFVKNMSWYLHPAVYFMVGGFLLIISGCSLFLWYDNRERDLADMIYSISYFISLILIIIGATISLLAFFPYAIRTFP